MSHSSCRHIASRLRPLAVLGAALAALALPTSALAAAHQVSGTVVAADGGSFTIQTSQKGMGVLNALITTANKITRQDLPYVYGGGHAEAGVASVGISGPGYTGHTSGYDCSGSVGAVLAGGGLWARGSGVPADNGIIAQLLSEHLIVRGVGRGPQEVTLWDRAGVHIFMNIDGRFFGTSDGDDGNHLQKRGGAGWLDDGAPDTTNGTFKPYHFITSALRGRTTYGPTLTLNAPSWTMLSGLATGTRVKVTYTTSRNGVFVARTLAYVGATTVQGTVDAISGSTLSITTSAGKTVALSAAANPRLLSGVLAGDTVKISYTRASGVLTVRSLSVTATPAIKQVSGTITSIATNGTSFALTTSSGQVLNISTAANPGLLAGLAPGDAVSVTYTQTGTGPLLAQRVTQATTYVPSQRTMGLITWIDPGDQTFAIVTPDGRTLVFSLGSQPGLLDGLASGDSVSVTYTQGSGGGLVAQQVRGV
jgi:hypothetical protein